MGSLSTAVLSISGLLPLSQSSLGLQVPAEPKQMELARPNTNRPSPGTSSRMDFPNVIYKHQTRDIHGCRWHSLRVLFSSQRADAKVHAAGNISNMPLNLPANSSVQPGESNYIVVWDLGLESHIHYGLLEPDCLNAVSEPLG